MATATLYSTADDVPDTSSPVSGADDLVTTGLPDTTVYPISEAAAAASSVPQVCSSSGNFLPSSIGVRCSGWRVGAYVAGLAGLSRRLRLT